MINDISMASKWYMNAVIWPAWSNS